MRFSLQGFLMTIKQVLLRRLHHHHPPPPYQPPRTSSLTHKHQRGLSHPSTYLHHFLLLHFHNQRRRPPCLILLILLTRLPRLPRLFQLSDRTHPQDFLNRRLSKHLHLLHLSRMISFVRQPSAQLSLTPVAWRKLFTMTCPADYSPRACKLPRNREMLLNKPIGEPLAILLQWDLRTLR